MSTPRPDAGSPEPAGAAEHPAAAEPGTADAVAADAAGAASTADAAPADAAGAAEPGTAAAADAAEGPETDTGDVTETADAPVGDSPAPVVRAVDVADPSRRRRAPRYGRFAVAGFLLAAVLSAVLTLLPQGGTPLAQYDPRDVFLILLIGLGTVGVLAGLTWALISDRRSLRRRR